MWRWWQVQRSQKERTIDAVYCKKEGDVVATSQLALLWKCDSSRTGCVRRATPKYVARTSNNRVISSGNLYCWLLPQCEALHTFRSSFWFATQQIYFLDFRMLDTWKWPEMNMYLDLNLVTFQYSILMDLDVIIFASRDLDWKWWLSFEFLRNFRFSLRTAGYCTDNHNRFSFRVSILLGIKVTVCFYF